MKSKIKRILGVFILLSLSITSYAQFNTIGSYRHRKVINQNSLESQETPKDTIVVSDSFPESELNEKEGEMIPPAPSVALPLKHIEIGSKYGMRNHPILHRYTMHSGIDLHAHYEEVYSMFTGTVIKVGEDNRAGKYVTIRTGDYTISYCHLSAPLVKVGMSVIAGNLIARSGNTGMSTGPHLHLTAKKDGKAFNPTILLEYIYANSNVSR